MLGLITFLLGGAIWFLATQLLTTPARITALARATVIGGFSVAAFGTLQNFGINAINPYIDASLEWAVSQGASTIGNPDSAGTFLVLPLVLSVALVLADKDRRWRVFEVISFVVIAYGLFITLTRGAWIGATVGLVVLLVAFLRSSTGIPKALKWMAGALVALLGVGLYQLGPMIARRFTELTQGASAGGGRLILWREALIVITRHPLTGVGPDSYRYGWFPIRLPEGMLNLGDVINNDPHNMLLLIAATLGVPALLTLLALLGVVLFRSGKVAFSTTQSAESIVFAGWWAALVGFGVALFFTFNTIPAMLTLWLGLGVLSAPSAKPVFVSGMLKRVVLPIALVSFGAGVVIISSLTLTSVYQLTLAKAEQSLPRAQAAVRLAPWNYDARVEEAFDRGFVAVVGLQNKDPRASELVKQADADMVALIAFNPHSPTGYSLRTAFLQEVGGKLGDKAYLERALEAVNAGLKVQPTSIELATKKAGLLSALNRFGEAADTMATVWELYPADPAPGVLYAEMLVSAGRTAQAKSVLAALASRFPGNPEVARVQALLDASK